MDSFDAALAAAAVTTPTSTAESAKRALVGGSFSSSSSAITIEKWNDLLLRNLVPHSEGLCSSVYRRSLSSPATAGQPSWPYSRDNSASSSSSSNSYAYSDSAYETLTAAVEAADGLPGWICIKRVCPDDVPRPHSIEREVALLSHHLVPSHRNIAALLAAIYDTSDPFGSVVDLVMPLYAATLEEVLEEPSLLPSISNAGGELEEEGKARPGSSIAHLWTAPTASFETFFHSTASQLLSGIVFLHAKEVAHRDIKPSNIVLSPNGTLKLIDLGTAYTTIPLPALLSDNDTRSSSVAESREEEWSEGGKMICQVGTGVFRAPELLLSPKGGYDASKVDVWAMGVTLAHFFTPLVACSNSQHYSGGADGEEMPSLDVEAETPAAKQDAGEGGLRDERKDWQIAFDSNKPFSSSSDISSDGGFWEESDDPLTSHSPSNQHRTASGYTRTPLFQAERGDIALAASIFTLLGLPRSVADWPEAEFFQPPLHRLPFAPTEGKGLVDAGLPLYTDFLRGREGERVRKVVENVIVPAIKLSASTRPSAKQLLTAIEDQGDFA